MGMTRSATRQDADMAYPAIHRARHTMLCFSYESKAAATDDRDLWSTKRSLARKQHRIAKFRNAEYNHRGKPLPQDQDASVCKCDRLRLPSLRATEPRPAADRAARSARPSRQPRPSPHGAVLPAAPPDAHPPFPLEREQQIRQLDDVVPGLPRVLGDLRPLRVVQLRDVQAGGRQGMRRRRGRERRVRRSARGCRCAALIRRVQVRGRSRRRTPGVPERRKARRR